MVWHCETYDLRHSKFYIFRVQRYIGPVEHVVYDQSSSPSRRVIVSTGQNVVAALSTKTGNLMC